MNLPSDILRSIILISKINVIKNLSSTSKSFYSLCCEKNLWLNKFKEKNLIIINDKIKSVRQYLNEYRKVSYAFYTANCVIDLIVNGGHKPYLPMIFFEMSFLIDDLKIILNNDHPIFTKVKDDKKFIYINIKIGTKIIYYDSPITNYNRFKILTEKCDNNIIMSLINKILYYYPSITINDINHIPIIKLKNLVLDIDDLNYYQYRIKYRKKYWDGCYSKYEELYF